MSMDLEANLRLGFSAGDAAAGYPSASDQVIDVAQKIGIEHRGSRCSTASERGHSEGALKSRTAASGARHGSKRTSASKASSKSNLGVERQVLDGGIQVSSRKALPPTPRTMLKDREIYEEVSSIVEELELVRERALAKGTHAPRAVEAALSALEPLLRLRDVTSGAFVCDLSLMPWLPDLLSVFRTVLRSAAGGSSSRPRTKSNADSGAGGDISAAVTPRGSLGGADNDDAAATAAAAAAAAAAALSALSSGGSTGCGASNFGGYSSTAGLEAALRQQKHREELLLRELEETRRSRDRLQERVNQLESKIDGGEWCSERDRVETRISDLVDLARDALEDNSHLVRDAVEDNHSHVQDTSDDQSNVEPQEFDLPAPLESRMMHECREVRETYEVRESREVPLRDTPKAPPTRGSRRASSLAKWTRSERIRIANRISGPFRDSE
eukprot:TRINITY_DN2378_c0_g1_i1.p1 TRINITY_DN2378_c0_g1~~TRINITY_DN2378_c0_g1_i1.p1  ORF type:complete len:443 (-),score=74.04 TRINITY_DN2378_c0_g1_i1:256-1584(-)